MSYTTTTTAWTWATTTVETTTDYQWETTTTTTTTAASTTWETTTTTTTALMTSQTTTTTTPFSDPDSYPSLFYTIDYDGYEYTCDSPYPVSDYFKGRQIDLIRRYAYNSRGELVTAFIDVYDCVNLSSTTREYILVYFRDKDKYYRYSRPK